MFHAAAFACLRCYFSLRYYYFAAGLPLFFILCHTRYATTTLDYDAAFLPLLFFRCFIRYVMLLRAMLLTRLCRDMLACAIYASCCRRAPLMIDAAAMLLMPCHTLLHADAALRRDIYVIFLLIAYADATCCRFSFITRVIIFMVYFMLRACFAAMPVAAMLRY